MPASRPDISLVSPWPGPPISELLQPCERPVILAGAGVSAGCGLPTGSELGLWMRRREFATGVDFSGLDRNGQGEHPGHVARQVLEEKPEVRRPMLVDVAGHIEATQARAELSRVVQAIAATPTGVVVTFNYDTIIEQAAEEAGRRAHPLLLDDIPQLVNDGLDQADGDIRVVHLHGVVDDPESLVLDDVSYMKQANSAEVQKLLTALVARNNLCAIGTQFEEDYLATEMLKLRPSHPRHVIVCGLAQAEKVRDGLATLNTGRHNWLPCSYPPGEHEVLGPFCERLVTCDDSPPGGDPRVPLDTAPPAGPYTPRRLIARDEVRQDSSLAPETQLQFGGLEAHSELSLRREQLSVVVGPPGSGKTRLVQSLAEEGGSERAVMLRLRDLRDVVGEPELLLRQWLEQGSVLAGETVPIGDVLAGRARVWLLLDGLDEAPLGRRRPLAEAIERLSSHYPQHRFTVTSRPVAALADLSDVWRVFDLLCDDSWRSAYLAGIGIEEEAFWASLGPAAPRLRSLLRIPFFLQGAVELREAGEEIDGAMQISLALLERALAVDGQLATLGNAPREMLLQVALLQQLSSSTVIGEGTLEAVAAEAELGDATLLADLLASRSLLVTSEGGWTFAHRLFGEALVAEQLLKEDPRRWIDCVAPEVDGWSAVLDQWTAPLQMVLDRSGEWRAEVASRDRHFAARATPREAPRGERLEAASTLWRRALEWDVWVEPVHWNEAGSDAMAIVDLIEGGDLDSLLEEIRRALVAPSRYARGNAVDVLAAVPVEDIAAVLADVLESDEDAVVRRSAASAARRLQLVDVRDQVTRWAMAPADNSEAAEMAAAAIALAPPERRLAVAEEIAEAGNPAAWDGLRSADLPAADRLAMLERQWKEDSASRASLARELTRLVAELGHGVARETAERLAHLAALLKAADPVVLEFAAANSEDAARGVVRALAERELSHSGIARLLGAIGPVALETAGADPIAVEASAGRPELEVRRVVSSPEAVLGPPALAAALRLAEPQRREQLARLVSLEREGVDELGDEGTEILRQTLDRWWGQADLRAAVKVEGPRADIEPWAATVLRFGAAARLLLDDERWIQVATCGWLFEPQLDWLALQATQDRVDQGAARAPSVRVLADLARIAGGFDRHRVLARLESTPLDDAAEVDLLRAGEEVARVDGLRGLERLTAADRRWAALLRPQLAAAGSLEAQLIELEEMVEVLEKDQRIPSIELLWLPAIRSREALPMLERALVAAGAAEPPGTHPSMTLPILGAIEAVGGLESVEVLDAVARERRYDGAQFLVANRNQVLQTVLGWAAVPAAESLARSLRLPLEQAGPVVGPRLLGEIGAGLREALAAMRFDVPAVSFSAGVEQVQVRGGLPEPERGPAPISLVLGTEAISVLGEDARATGLLEDRRIRLWLTGLAGVGPGSRIRVSALVPGGASVHAEAEVRGAPGSLELQLEWVPSEAPGEIAFTILAD
jgi:hypothetical protein